MASFGEETGRGRSGHVSGRIISSANAVRGPSADVPQAPTRRRTGEHTTSHGGGRADSGVRSAGVARRPGAAAYHDDGEAHSSDESFDSAPPRRKPQPINAELVKLVASFAPLELAQLKAMEQKARLKKARAAAAAQGEPTGASAHAAAEAEASGFSGAMAEDANVYEDAQYEDAELEAPAPAPGHQSRRQSAAGRAADVHGATSTGRSKSPGAGRPSHLPAAPAKGAVVKRDLNILPNPVALKQTEAVQRQQAVTNFVHRLQKEQDAVRAEKERRLQAEKEELAAQVAEATEAAKEAAAQVTTVPEPKPPPIKKKKPVAAPGAASGLHGMQAMAAEAEPEKKPADPRPWRQNMKRRPTPISGDAPTGAPPDVGPIPMTGAPPPRSISPSAAAANMRTLDPVARMQLKEFMDRKAKEVSIRQAQERAAQQEAKTAHLRVVKAEMAKARQRAQRYAESGKDAAPATRPAWVDVAPGENAGTALLNRPAPARRPPQEEADFDVMSERALPHHMSDAMRMEVIERRRRERLQGPGSPQRGGRSVLVDDFGNAIDSDMESGPQVVRVHDPDTSGQTGRVYRAGSARPTRPLVTAPQRPASAHPAVRPAQPLPPPPSASQRAVDLEARLAARKLYDQQLREMQAAERRDSSRGHDTSRARDNSRGRTRSPTAGRKHHSSTVRSRSRSRSPHKRAKQSNRRSRSGSRAGSATRRKSTAPGGARGSAVSAVQAELQQARNEQHVGDLWDLALQLSARLGALQQQQGYPVGAGVPPAWPESQQLPALLPEEEQYRLEQQWLMEQQLMQQEQQMGLLPEGFRDSVGGSMAGYPLGAMAVVPTDLQSQPLYDDSLRASPQRPPVDQFDEGTQAEVEFRSEVSWPTAVHKKARVTGSSSGGGAAVLTRLEEERSTGAYSYSTDAFESMGGASQSTATGVPESIGEDATSQGSSSAAVAAGRLDATRGMQTGGSMRAVSFTSMTSGLRSAASATSRDQDVSSFRSKQAVASLSSRKRPEQDAEPERPARMKVPLIGVQQPGAAAPTARPASATGGSAAGAPPIVSIAASPAKSVTVITAITRTASGAANPIPAVPPALSPTRSASSAAPPSPAKSVPAAPIIQIPLPPANTQPSADSVEPSPGLPYDNGAYSAESAEEGSSSGEESGYGQRVYTISQLHNILEENPRLAQRLTLERERDRWEADEVEGSPLRSSLIKPLPRPRSPEPQPGPGDDSSDASSAPDTPARACEDVVNEYEQANSPIRIRPAQRELMKAQAAKRAEEQQELALQAATPQDEEIGAEPSADDMTVLTFPKSGDPMSIINLIAHKGRLPERPAIIQLSEPPLAQVVDHETQTILVVPVSEAQTQPVPRHFAASEVLVIPGTDGTQLVFSRELVQPQREQPQQLPIGPASPPKYLTDTGVGDERVAAPSDLDFTAAQELNDSLPPYVLMPAATSQTTGISSMGTQAQPQSQPSLQQQVDLLRQARQAAAVAATRDGPALMAQLGRLSELRSGSGAAAGAASGSLGGALPDGSIGGASQDASAGLTGVMASPPPRPRMVSFIDEPMGPPDRVRLAPNELYKQMQDTLKTYEELDAAELELQQLQNARAIAAVQREAHRIAQRLDQTAIAESQAQLMAQNAEAQALVIAQAQAEMDAKLVAMEENLRSEVRKESLHHLNDVTSMFLQQLTRNKVAHANVQTMSEDLPQPRKEMAVQVEPVHPPSILRHTASSPSPPRPPPTSLRADSPSAASPPIIHRGTSPTPPPAVQLRTSLRSPSPPQPAVPTSLRSSPVPTYQDQHPYSRGGSPGPSEGGAAGLRSRVSISNVASEYTEVFDEDEEEDTEPQARRGQPVRPASRSAYRQTSTLSVPESVYEDEEFEEYVEEESGVYSRGTSRPTTRQPSRVTIRPQVSTRSVAESNYSDRPPLKSALRQQTSTMSIPESVEDEDEPIRRAPSRGVNNQASTMSVAESIRSERTESTRRPAPSAGRRQSVAESVPYSSVGVSGESGESGSIPESVPQPQASHSHMSVRSRRPRSSAATTEPGYSMSFEDAEVMEDDVETEEPGTVTGTEVYSEDFAEEPSQVSGRRPAARQPAHRGAAATASTRSTEVDDEVQTEEPGSYSQDATTVGESGLGTSGSSGRVAPAKHQQLVRASAVPGQVVTTPVADPKKAKAAATPQSPLLMRVPMEGGLELDDEMMQTYTADAEAQMLAEVTRLQERLAAITAAADTKMVQLEDELGEVKDPQRRQAIIRLQRLVQVQRDADEADLQRQIHAVKADYARQQLYMERLYRLAQITSPAAAAKRTGTAPAAAVATPTASKRTGAAPAAAPAAKAPSRGPAPKRQASVSSSIVEEDYSEPQMKESGSGSIVEEVATTRGERTGSGSIVEERSAAKQHRSRSGSILEESSIPGTAAGRTASVASEVSYEYTGDFEPPSAHTSRRQLLPAGRPAKPARQQSSVMDEIEENLSHRRLGTSGGGMSQSVVTEDDVRHRSGSTAGRSSSHQRRGRSSGSDVADSDQYSEDYDAKAKHKARAKSACRRTSASEDLEGGSSELSVMSAALERQQAELQLMLKRKQKELRDKERRAKLLAKQAAVEALQKQLAALEARDAKAAPAKQAAKAPAAAKPRHDSDAISESSIPAYSEEQQYGTASESVADEVGSFTPRSMPDVRGRSGSVVSESIRSESHAGGRRAHHTRSSGSVTESVAYTEPDEEAESASYATASVASGSKHHSGSRSSEIRAAQRLSALHKAVAAKEKELRHLQIKQEEEALQRRLKELEDQERNLKSGPPPKPPKPPGAATTTAPVQRKPAPAAGGHSSYGTSGDSAAYSEDFASGAASGTIPGGYASSSVVDEVPSQSVLRAAPRAGSRSSSIVDEYSSDNAAPSSRAGGLAGGSGSIVDEASSVPRGGSASASGDVYAESFETDSVRGASALRDASEILDEAGGGTSGETAAGAASLDVIQEEDVRTASFRSAGRSAGASRAALEDEVDELDVDYSDEVQELQASRSAVPVGEASGGELEEEEGALAGASVQYSQENVQDEVQSIQDLEAASIEHSASQPDETVQEFMTTANSHSPSAAPSGEASVAEEVVNVREFTRTADTIGASFAPSVNSADLEPIASGSAATASVEGSVVYSEPQEQQSPAASGAGEIEEEDAPFVVQQRSPTDSSDIEEVAAAEPASASGDRGASGSIVEEQPGRSAVSASALEDIEPEELEVEYSEDAPEPASVEVEEEEPFVVKERGGSDEEEEEEEVPEAEVEYSEDAVEPASAEVEEEEPFVVKERGSSDDDEEVADEAAGVEVEEDEYTLDDIEVEDEEVDASARTMTMEVTDVAAETTMPVEEAEEEEAYTDSFHTSAVTGTGTGTASGQSGALGTTGDVQDASTLLGQTSLQEVASASSLGGSRLVGREGSAISARGAGPSNLGKQASSMSTNTYGEEDFEEDFDGSELPGLSAPGDRTALSVVDEEAEPGVSVSHAYTEDFPTASADITAAVASTASAAPAAGRSLPSAAEEASEESAEVEDVAEDVEYSEDLAAEEDEEEDAFGVSSGAPPGPVLQPAATAQVGVEVSQRYGPVSAGSSGGYSEDFPEDPAEEAEAADEEEGGEEEDVEPPEPILAHKEPSEEAVTLAAARSAPPQPAAAAEQSGGTAEAEEESGSVFSVEEETLEDADADAEESSTELPLAAAAASASSTPAPAPEPEATADDDYTRDFTLDVEDTAALSSASAAPRATGDLSSHPISQPQSPPAGSDDEGAGSERHGSVLVHATPPGERADSEEQAAKEEEEEVVEEEYEDDLEEDDGLDVSDLGLEPPPVSRAAPEQAPATEATDKVEPEQQAEPEAEQEASGVRGLAEPEMEDSGIITVPSGRGIRQTRNIESRRWRNRDAMLAEEDEDEEDLDGAELDLVDMSMVAGEGGDLLAMLGADFIEANEAVTPSHSFRLRADLSSGTSAASGSPFGALRTSLSHRLATLREQQEQEGEEGTEASSEAITPHSRQPPLFDSETEGRDGEAAQQEQEKPEVEVEEVEEVVEEEEVDLAASGDEEDEAPFKPAAAAPPAPAADEEEDKVIGSRAASAPAPVAEKSEPAPEPAAAVAAAAEPSAEYSEAGLEAPSEGGSGGRQSVVEYDLYTSAALAATDSDDLAEYAANFESQAIGEDDDDEAVAAEVSGISASGLSDDLGKYQATAHPESDEEEAIAAAAPAPSAADVAAALTAAEELPAPPLAKEKSPSIHASDEEEEEVLEEEEIEEVEEEELGAASNNPFSVDESIDRMPALSPHGAAKPPAPITSARELSSPTESAAAAAEEQPGLKSALDDESEHKATLKVAVEPAPQEPASPTVSSPASRRSSADLAGETSLGPLPRSGLVGDDDEDDDGTGLEYRALYKPEPSEPAAGLEAEPSGPSPVRADAPPTASAAASPLPTGDVTASVIEEEEAGTGGVGVRGSGLLDQLRAFVGSDDDDEDADFGASGGLATRHLSGASLKPALQSLLDQPDEEGVSKGDFESEIEEMLAASRRQSRLQSPFHSRDWSEAATPEVTTPYSLSTRASMAGTQPERVPSGTGATLLAVAAAAAAAASQQSTGSDQSSWQPRESDADSEGLLEALEQKEPTRDELADQITAATVKELVAEAVNVMASIAGGAGELPATQAAGAVAGLAVQVSSPRASLSSLQMQTTPKHRLANVSSFHYSEADLQKLEAEVAAQEAAAPAPAAEASAKQEAAAAGASGETSSASISMSAGDLEGDIELDAEEDVEEVVEEALSVEGEDEDAAPGIIELPSPLPSESGSISSSISPRRAYEPPGASKLSTAGPASVPALAPEASDRDLAVQPSEGDDGAGGTSGVGLTSDEDLGWGGADEEEAELEEGWQSGYIAPEMDQAAIEREHAPAVATSHEAVSEYVGQVLDQFMDARPEFLEPGADPLSLEGFLAQERRLVDASEAQHIHNKMLYDAVNEALLGIYRAANRVQSQPWLRTNRVVKPLPSPAEMLEQVQKQIKAWSSMRMRDPAEIDKVLAQDAQEDERAWTDLTGAEVEVKREVAEALWADLVGDTAQVLADLEQLLAPPVTTSFRRRML